MGAGYETVLAPDILRMEYDQLAERELELEERGGADQLLPDIETQNIIVLSLLLVLGLTTNLLAFPVILFRRTKFGNGQFAVLVLCLTVADIFTLFCGLLGGLVLEAGHMTWDGSTSGCSAYYFLTTWLMGLANYLVSALLAMVHVKRSTGWISRLQECKALLLSLTLATLLPALTELLVRSTISVGDGLSVCIITAEPLPYGLYIAFKLLMLHILPVIILILTLIKPRTKTAKRFSTLFLGEGSACECGPSGEELKVPHECPSIGTRPDLVTSHREVGKATVVTVNGGGKPRTISIREDPHRRKYKCLLSWVFLSCTLIYIIAELSYQVQSLASASAPSPLTSGLVSLLYAASYTKQIINPVLLVYVEFFLQ